MTLNKQKGNMYGFVTHTWNVIKGICSHDCPYCYMKRFPQKELHFDEKELKTDLGKDNFIFVGSSTDMFADEVPEEWIIRVLDHCSKYNNTYLFQTKNPERFEDFIGNYPDKSIFGTTIETNRKDNLGACQERGLRASWMCASFLSDKRKMVTIEPIMDFDLEVLVKWIQRINPEFVNIGADSNTRKNYVLAEPSKEKVLELIKELKKITKVNLKDNLQRLVK